MLEIQKDPELLLINIRELLDHVYGVMLSQNSNISGWWNMIGFDNRLLIIKEMVKAALNSEDVHSPRCLQPLGSDIIYQELRVLLKDSYIDEELIPAICFSVLELIYEYLKTHFPNLILTYGLLNYRVQYLKCDTLILSKIPNILGANYEFARV